MLPRGRGAILFTGASASVKGYKLSAPFAMGKFALRGLAQSIARELAPQGIHVAPFRDRRCDPQPRPELSHRRIPISTPMRLRAPTSHVLRQDRSAWTWEVEMRPWVENF